MEQMHTVFVSHAHADNALCDRYVTALRAHGLDVWYDRTNLQDGQMLSTVIERELEQRTTFVVLLTPASVGSYWVKLETDAFRSLAARDDTRLMLPVRIAECKVPLLMAGIKWVDAVSLGFEAAVEAMATALGAAPAASATTEPAESVDDLIELGMAFFVQSRYAEALPFFERAGRRDPRNVDVWAILARTYSALNRLEEGLAASERALALNANFVGAWYAKGIVLGGLGRRDEALAAFDHALALDPNYLDAQTARFLALRGLWPAEGTDAAG